ncbi:MAG: phosphoribosylanthranilate isomerase [Deltaproteobacteria bacterium]|jgi:phosphoribosylanthranilate isomerase|nr:phosphoribosylanthranilate isomerase [Deltaproteobacteria bacterium]
MKVKICGITRCEDARAALELGADLIGLNFYQPSPRYVSLERAREVRAALGARIPLVGVFVNAARACVEKHRAELGLALLQFHGDESEEELGGWPVPVIRAIRLRTASFLLDAQRALGFADYLLLDAFEPGLFGGTGRRLDLAALARLDLGRVFIAGGLDPDNVAQVRALQPYGVDVAGGVESRPGIKDHQKLRRFIAHAKGLP